MHFCLIEAEESLTAITGNRGGRIYTSAEQKLGRLRSELDYSRIDDIIEQGLHEFIDQFQVRLNEVGEAIHETFFAPQAARRQPRRRNRRRQSQTHAQTRLSR